MARGDLNASVNGNNQRGSALSDSPIDVAVMRVLQSKLGLDPSDMQALQRLVGKRSTALEKNTRPGAAAKRGDFSALGNMNPMRSQPVTAAPTATDYNNLRADVLQVFSALQAIAVVFASFEA
jgi:hypothetical protein